MKPNISVLVPTRQRTELLHRMLESLVARAEHPESIEVVFRVDRDDRESILYLSEANITGWLNMLDVQIIVGPHLDGYVTLPVFINECARLAKADLLIVINDDVEFRTQDWDTKLIAKAAEYPDGIFNLGVDTVMNNPNFVFPCQSRRQVELLGCFFDERLVYPDIWLRDVLMHFGRAIHVPEITIEHRWVGLTEDQQRAIPLTQNAAYEALYGQCVREGIEKIQKVWGPFHDIQVENRLLFREQTV